MRSQIEKLISLGKFVKIAETLEHNVVLKLKKTSKLLVCNIQSSWLKVIHSKTSQHFPIYLNKNITQKYQKPYYGFINDFFNKNIDHVSLSNNEFMPENKVVMELNLLVPQQDLMQHFIQWQRYRKYWWSSITTTPSLFAVNDMKHGEESADVNIVANFAWGQHVVETVRINSNGFKDQKNNNCSSLLTCSLGLETALLTLLLDGLSNSTKEEYLRLHNKMAPYKISFALQTEDPKTLASLKDLARLLYHKLSMKEISAFLPTFSLPLQSQIKDNLQMGITYTAILSEITLSNGIFHLLNSSTMLKEQVHVADFDTYAALLCGKN